MDANQIGSDKMKENLHIRISILNPGSDVTPLKFRGWLRTEAADIDRKTQQAGLEHEASIIRLFLPERLRLAIGQDKLDKILQDIVEKFATIYSIDLRSVEAPLTFEEILQEQAQAQADLGAIAAATKSGTKNDKPTLH